MRTPLLSRTPVVLGFYGLLAVAFCWPLFAVPNALGVTDWDQHLFYYGSVLANVVRYGQMPFWNPWYCGGDVLWQNPQIALLSPVYPLTAVMSLALAMKVNIVLHYWLGFVGMHFLLTRILGLTYLPLVVYLGSVFTLAGGLALHLNAGHSVFLPAFYLPLLVYFFLRSLHTERVRDTLPGGAILALTIFNGGLHIVPIALVAVGGIAAAAALVRRRARPLVLAVVLGLAGFSYAAPKLLPAVLFVEGDQFADSRTGQGLVDRQGIAMMVRAYVDPYQNRSLRSDDTYQRHKWYEYGNYIGALAAILTIVSVLWIGVRGRYSQEWLGIALAATTVLLLLLSAGEFSWLAPASLIGHLPLFSSFRVPSRYGTAVPLLSALTIGWVARTLAVDRLEGGTRRFLGMVCATATVFLLVENRAQFNGVFPIPPLAEGFHLLSGSSTLEIDRDTDPYGPDSPMLRALAGGRSIYQCYEPLQLTHTADADRPIVFGEGTADVQSTRFSPNRIEFAVVNGREPSRVRLNQNHAAGWSSTAGPVTPAPGDGKPSVVLAPGQTGRFAFVFAPPGLWLGTGVFGVAILGSMARRRRASRKGGNGAGAGSPNSDSRPF